MYDAFMYGNGLTINFLGQIRGLFDPRIEYLLSFDSFLKAYINDDIRGKIRYKIDIYNFINQEFRKEYYPKFVEALRRYYDVHKDGNFEFNLGLDALRTLSCGYDFYAISSVFPYIYNIWHEILHDQVIEKHKRELDFFVASIQRELSGDPLVYTVNFDHYFDSLIRSPQHIHGRFVKGHRNELTLYTDPNDPNRIHYKCIWAVNGLEKLKYIADYSKLKESNGVFDFGFVLDESLPRVVNNLLVYGMSFQISSFPFAMGRKGKYIDDHILYRIRNHQNEKRIEKVTFTYYTDDEKRRFEEIVADFNFTNVEIVHSSSLNFVIT